MHTPCTLEHESGELELDLGHVLPSQQLSPVLGSGIMELVGLGGGVCDSTCAADASNYDPVAKGTLSLGLHR